MRFKVAKYVRSLEPIEWPDGTDQPVKSLTWDVQEMLADVAEGVSKARDVMPKVMPMILPGRSWDEIKSSLSVEAMQSIIAYASGQFEEAMKELEGASGNAQGATAPASPPTTPVATSSAESLVASAAPCGT